jgi:hypothetical protein
MTTQARFWFDPSCPYTWLVSRWMREVERLGLVRVTWQVMSLSVLNEGRDDDPENDPEGFLWWPARLFAAVQDRYGPDALGSFYDTYGRLVHEVPAGSGAGWRPVEEIIDAAGLPADLADVVRSAGIDDVLRASHGVGIGKVGPHVGTPITAATMPDGREVAWFGPVISRVPHGDEAAALWNGTLLVAGVDGFNELKGRPPAPLH